MGRIRNRDRLLGVWPRLSLDLLISCPEIVSPEALLTS